jgi:hypothetical protein
VFSPPATTHASTNANSSQSSAMSSTNSAPTTTTRGRASRRICRHSRGASRQLTGTKTAPAFDAAKYRIGYQTVFWASTATRVSRPQPPAISRFAIRFAAAAAAP